MKPSTKLTAKQERFCEEYLVDLNATQAAIRAGYSKKTSASIGDENLRKPAIAEKLKIAREELSRRTEMSADWVIAELRERYFALLDKGDDKGSCIPLKLIGQHFDAFPNRVEHAGPGGGPIVTVTKDMTDKEAARLALYFMLEADPDVAH